MTEIKKVSVLGLGRMGSALAADVVVTCLSAYDVQQPLRSKNIEVIR